MGPFAIALMVTVALAALGVLRQWLALTLLGIGVGGSVGMAVAAALGFGFFVNAPLMVKVRAKHSLICLVYVVVAFGTLSLVGPLVPERANAVLQMAAVAGGAVVLIRPLFGYGRLGRELTKAVKDDERATWRN